MAYRVKTGTGLLSGKGDQGSALDSVISTVEAHNRVPAYAKEHHGVELNHWESWSVPGKWWVYEDKDRCLEFMPARKSGLGGIRVLGTVTIEEVA